MSFVRDDALSHSDAIACFPPAAISHSAYVVALHPPALARDGIAVPCRRHQKGAIATLPPTAVVVMHAATAGRQWRRLHAVQTCHPSNQHRWPDSLPGGSSCASPRLPPVTMMTHKRASSLLTTNNNGGERCRSLGVFHGLALLTE